MRDTGKPFAGKGKYKGKTAQNRLSPRIVRDVIILGQAVSILLSGIMVIFAATFLGVAIPVSLEAMVKYLGMSSAIYFAFILSTCDIKKGIAKSYTKELRSKLMFFLFAMISATVVIPVEELLHGDALPFLVTLALTSSVILASFIHVTRSFVISRVKSRVLSSQVAIYGAGDIANRLYKHLQENPDDMYHFVGLYDERLKSERVDHTLEIDGDLDDLLEAGRSGQVDRAIIALPQSAFERIQAISRKLEELPIEIDICTHISDKVLKKLRRQQQVSSIGPVGLMNIKNKPISDWGVFIKKIEDYLVAFVALVLTLPVFALIAIAIKLDSSGPVFFRQKRHGLNHKEIDVLKFRTMHVQQPDVKIVQASKSDPRVTWVGWFLRRSSLDELPQLINVLKGEMSIVGPRPHAISHNEEYSRRVEEYSNRHQVKPGLTGWAQVNGLRGETKDISLMEARVKHDLLYIDNWSLVLDLKIIFMTPFYALASKNAY